MAENVKIKKVQAYPIACNITVGTTGTLTQILKLTLQGFLADCPIKAIRPGDRVGCSFEIPVMHHMISEPCKVIKVYNQYNTPTPESPLATPLTAASAGGKSANSKDAAQKSQGQPAPTAAAKSTQIVEFHFVALQGPNRDRIGSFLQALQKQGMK